MILQLAACVLASNLEVAPIPAELDPTSAPPKRVLVYTVSAGFVHDVVKRPKPDELSIVEQALVDLGKKTGDFEAVPTLDAAAFTSENLAKYDLVFFYTTGELPLSEAQRNALFAFVKGGKAFAGAHCAADTFYKVPEYGEMIGAYFDLHPWHQEVRVKVEDRTHPATAHLGESFSVNDEIYQYKDPYDRKKLHVLLSLDTSSVDMNKPEVHRKDGDFALAWCKDYDKGRVFYTALGHEPALWKDERYLAMLDGGFRWAMRMTEAGTESRARESKGGAATDSKDKKKESEKPPQGGLSAAASAAPSAAADPAGATHALPNVHDGFAIDLVAEAPEILWPSSNACLPDGSLLVGEDRMDMPGPTNEPLDRVIELRWKPDGSFEKKVFADHLFAVMGMAVVDDAVYVMNMPHLTRLVDKDGDGVADERTEVLTDLGHPAPGWPGGFNDHIVSGIRLGMDGFLYVAVGDKGIPGAHGTDGRTLQLRGGGVVRVRPDGTGLEIVASGLRNILDVAIDERGEMFTYDNTDDGLGWWTRLTHIVAGGYYGYPWDYHEHQDRMLPCMAEYGGGSPTGGLAYREAAWPAEFHDNLFFCEWGNGALRRFVLEPSGATFKVKTAENFVSAGDVKAFKPLDVCESPDGRFLYLSDWGYEGWTNPKEAGRIWRIRRADDDPKRPSVAKALPKDVDGLIEALDDPSFGVRLRAQRELARRESSASPNLLRVLGDAERSPERRVRHAIWALAEDRSAALQLGMLAARASASIALQAIRALGHHPAERLDDLVQALHNVDPAGRREAAIALSRTEGDLRPRASKEVAACVDWWWGSAGPEPDAFLLIPWSRAVHSLGEYPSFGNERYTQRTDLVFRGAYDRSAVDSLLSGLRDRTSPELRVRALPLLADLERKAEPWDRKWWGIQPAKTPPPSHVVDWECTEKIRAAVLGALGDPDKDVRRAALQALRTMDDRSVAEGIRRHWSAETDDELRALMVETFGSLKDEGSAQILGAVVRDPHSSPDLRKKAIEAACAIRSPELIDLLASIAGDSQSPAAHAVPCLAALGRLRETRTAPSVRRALGSSDDAIRIAAVSAIVDVSGAQAAPELESLLANPSQPTRKATLAALGRLRLVDATPKILPLVDDASTRDDATLALAAAPDPRAVKAYLLGLDSKSKNVRDASRTALSAVRDGVRATVEDLCTHAKLTEGQLAALQTIYSDPQPILDWQLLGPFERRKEPKPSEPTGTWQSKTAEPVDGFVDLVKAFDGKSDRSAYARAEFRSSIDREADMSVGSDDSVSVWVNGELVHVFDDNRAFTADQDKFRVKLRAGMNTILLLVGNTSGGWSFNAKVSGEGTGPLFARKANRPDLEERRKYVLAHKGDPSHGFDLFRKSKDESMCIRCHTAFGVGEKVGPDLSDVGAKYSREEILASILTPSQRIAEGYRSTSIELQDGRVFFGMVQKETKDTIELYDTNGEKRTIDKADVASRGELDTSVMPDGLWMTLSAEDLTDLVDWLTTLRGSPGVK
jgi:putative membrane-bound dehydrogenase-like protein